MTLISATKEEENHQFDQQFHSSGCLLRDNDEEGKVQFILLYVVEIDVIDEIDLQLFQRLR